MDRRTRQLRRRRARRRQLAALGVIALVALLLGVAVAWARGGHGAGGTAAGGATGRAASSSSGGSGSSVNGASDGGAPADGAPATARVVSGGDVMPDRSVEAYANANGPDAVLEDIAPVLQKGDAAWVNLEGVTSTLGTPKTEKVYTFEGPPEFAPALATAGIDVVTMGNNHSVDYGRAALRDTIARLETAGVQVVGAGKDFEDAHAPAIVTTPSGATVGFLGYSDVWWPGFEATESHAGVAQAFTGISRMKQDIKDLSTRVDYVVVGFHWGYEYQHYPVSQQTSEGHAAIDAGADLVIGHHPHVLQGFETYKRRLIAYSLGDLVFDHVSVPSGQTVLVDATLKPDGVTARLVPAYASTAGIPSIQHGEAGRTILELVEEYSAPLDTSIRIDGDIGYVRAGKK
jgi:poly-gamma-glutamate capsule biosynthesis protein CapA/YwtB (metallophosphatase superfamily)